jgi:UDP-N-acetylmuramate--alanine ligase
MRDRKRDIGIHFIGIGGIGMSGIARIAAQLEYPITGSDLNSSQIVSELASLGCEIHRGHAPSNIGNPDLVVVSSAIGEDNPELQKARKMNIPVISRAKMLGILMNSSRGIAIAGTHGKTTASAMVSTVLESGGLDPTVVVGGYTNEFKGNAKLGTGDFFVAEADESDGSLLELNPEIAVINNIDNDHIDFYGSVEELHKTFREFIRKVPTNGMVAISIDDPILIGMKDSFSGNVVTYGIENGADLKARGIYQDDFSISFEVLYRGKLLGEVKLNKPGLFNVYNALAAISIGLHVGMPFAAVKKGLAKFSGVKRRFDILKQTPEMIVIDDYAHHPSEVKATLGSIRSNHSSRIIGVFQPHRYSRMKHLAEQFGDCFHSADEVVVTDIYSAGETPIPFVTSDLVLDALKRNNQRYVEYIPNIDDIPDYIESRQKKGDLVVTLGAGDVWKVAHTLAAKGA